MVSRMLVLELDGRGGAETQCTAESGASSSAARVGLSCWLGPVVFRAFGVYTSTLP